MTYLEDKDLLPSDPKNPRIQRQHSVSINRIIFAYPKLIQSISTYVLNSEHFFSLLSTVENKRNHVFVEHITPKMVKKGMTFKTSTLKTSIITWLASFSAFPINMCTFLPINAGKGTPPPDMHPIFTKSINWKKKLGQIVLLLLPFPTKKCSLSHCFTRAPLLYSKGAE